MGRKIMVASVVLILGVFGILSTVQAASIVGSYHDLAHIDDVHTGPEGRGRTFDDYNQVCVYCHTPHNASTTQKPLWNRPDSTATYQVYASSTLSSAPGQPGAPSRLCLSCHDGTIAVDKVLNQPNTGVESNGKHGTMVYPRQVAFTDCASCHQTPLRFFTDFTPSYLGTNLANDHPVGIAYLDKPGMVPVPSGGRFSNGVCLVDGMVECTSCHAVHDPANKPFLRVSNDGSGLCYTCHAK